MSWLKQNWFKLFILIAIYLYIAGFFFDKYQALISHNMGITKYCIEEAKKSGTEFGKTYENCIEMFKRKNYFLPW